jgi:hypothetical protein
VTYPHTCGKIRYPTEADARAALVQIVMRGIRTGPKKERQVYACTRCHGFHLTSMRSTA